MTLNFVISKPNSILTADDYDTAYDFLNDFVADNFCEAVVYDGEKNTICIEIGSNDESLGEEIEMEFNSYFGSNLKCAVC